MMRWYYIVRGEHTHVRVFINGALAGTLCFRTAEFERLMNQCRYNHEDVYGYQVIEFIAKTEKDYNLLEIT